MPATLIIEISDELWGRLRQQASEQGKTPEAFAADCLASAAQMPQAGLLRRWAGAWASNVPEMRQSVTTSISARHFVSNWASRHMIKDWTLVDCASFVVMQQRGLTEALATDHHFEQAGFVRLLK